MPVSYVPQDRMRSDGDLFPALPVLLDIIPQMLPQFASNVLVDTSRRNQLLVVAYLA